MLEAAGRNVKPNENVDSSTSDEEDCGKRKRPPRPERLRKRLYEILLRKRIFLTDRLEKLEKVLLT
jgi:hypothetical protein